MVRGGDSHVMCVIVLLGESVAKTRAVIFSEDTVSVLLITIMYIYRGFE